jgi:hypothetical protein
VIGWLGIGALIAFFLWAAWLGSKCGENGYKAKQHSAYGALSGGTKDYDR